ELINALTAAADHCGDCDELEELAEALLAVAVDGYCRSARGRCAAGLPGDAKRLSADARQRRRQGCCRDPARRVAVGGRQRHYARPGPANRRSARRREGLRRQTARVCCALSGRRRYQPLQPHTGKSHVSAEFFLVVGGIKHSSQTKANLPLRGIGQEGAAVRKGITITAGRMFAPGSNEIVVGKALLKEFDGLELGQTVTFGTGRWTVVGVFEAAGSVFESEIWADLPVVQSFFKRDNVFETIRVRLLNPAALD